MVHADDDRAGSQKQQRLEKRMRHQVEYRHRISGCAQGHCHITQLRQRGIRHHPLDIGLDNAQKAHEQRGDGADHQDEIERGIRQFKQRRHARHHEDSGRHHRRSVDQR